MGYSNLQSLFGHTASGTEYCSGFRDEHGQWNNGFYCPKWGPPDLRYCCGPQDHKYCCPKEETLEKLHGNQTQQLSLLIGLAVGSFILVVATIVLACYFCRCCWAYKRRKRAQAGSPVLPAYPGYSRDSADPVNYAVCPHGTVLPEFLVSAPQYPSEAPPPYPGYSSDAPPMENKETLPPPHVQVHDGVEPQLGGVQLSPHPAQTPGNPRVFQHSTSEPAHHQYHADHARSSAAAAAAAAASEYTNLVNGSGGGGGCAGGLPSESGCRAMPVLNRSISDSRRPYCCHDMQRHAVGGRSPSLSTSSRPGTSRHVGYHIPKMRPSSSSSTSSHGPHRPKRRSAYDSRSISSDSDTFSG